MEIKLTEFQTNKLKSLREKELNIQQMMSELISFILDFNGANAIDRTVILSEDFKTLTISDKEDK